MVDASTFVWGSAIVVGEVVGGMRVDGKGVFVGVVGVMGFVGLEAHADRSIINMKIIILRIK